MKNPSTIVVGFQNGKVLLLLLLLLCCFSLIRDRFFCVGLALSIYLQFKKQLYMKKLLIGIFIFSFVIASAQTDTTLIEDKPVKIESPEPKTQKVPSQKKDAMPFIKKFYFGGTFGATFGKYSSITLAPTIGYAVKPSLYAGVKFYYTYSKQTISYLTRSEDYVYHTYGVGTFLRWYAFRDLYLHVAPEMINYQNNFYDASGSPVESSQWVPFVWAGAGYRKMVGKRSWLSAHVLFDLLQDENSPHKQWEPNFVIGAGTSF